MRELSQELLRALQTADQEALDHLRMALLDYATDSPMTFAYQRLAETSLTAYLLTAIIEATGAIIDPE